MDKGAYPGRHVISLEDIPEEGLCLNYDDVPGLLTDPDDPGLEGPVRVDACLNRIDRFIYLHGSVETVVNLVCDRCLSPYPFEVNAQFSYLLIPHSLEGEGLDAARGKDIPFGEILREQILLQIPFRRLCSEGCMGICPSCGADIREKRLLTPKTATSACETLKATNGAINEIAAMLESFNRAITGSMTPKKARRGVARCRCMTSNMRGENQ